MYLNTADDVAFVGSQACTDCHSQEHATFALSPHNQALAELEEADEPPDGEFYHAKSGRTYRVYRIDGEFRHREELGDLVLGDYPVAYRIGSGNHSRSYLIEIEGFLFESPITWYAAKNEWALSPGYDFPNHESFMRPAHEGCVHCHAGRVESIAGSVHRLKFHEMQIRCESCHGPGELHVRYRSEQAEPESGVDRTIVHPARLSRELNEAICARCHLAAAAVAAVRGRHRNDFRPGLPLTDFRVDYTTEQKSQSMTVVGHFEQMHQSSCYAKSETLTCTTCHNPHQSITPRERVEHYRQICLSCHAEDSGCRLGESDRLAKNAENDCTACHMPKSGTDIPHFAFTHHRIGFDHSRRYEENAAATTLVPFGDVSHLPASDRERCLGLGYFHYGDKQAGPERRILLDQAYKYLNRAHRAGLQDAKVLGGLAYLLWERGDARCLDFAEQAVHFPDCQPETKANSLIVLGDMHLRNHNFSEAQAAFQELTTLRLRPVDWQMLGICRSYEGDMPGAIQAFQKAITLRPDQPELYHLLSDAYSRSRQPQFAQEARRQALRLTELRSD